VAHGCRLRECSVFRPAVQAFLPPRWAESGVRGPLTPGRLAHAERCRARRLDQTPVRGLNASPGQGPGKRRNTFQSPCKRVDGRLSASHLLPFSNDRGHLPGDTQRTPDRYRRPPGQEPLPSFNPFSNRLWTVFSPAERCRIPGHSSNRHILPEPACYACHVRQPLLVIRCFSSTVAKTPGWRRIRFGTGGPGRFSKLDRGSFL